MRGYGYHWTPCPGRGSGRGGGSGPAVAAVLVVIVAAACAGPVVSAASSALRAVIEALEIVGLVIVSAAGLGMLALLAVAGARIRRRMLAGRPIRAVVVASAEPVGEAARAELPARVVPALPRADVSALPRADVQPHVVTGRVVRSRRARRDERRS
jgi:hypothetical protein